MPNQPGRARSEATRVSRARTLLSCAAALVALAAASVAHADDRRDRDRDRECPAGRELMLVNGRIHTMDARGSIVSSVTIRNGKFASVGDDRGGGGGGGDGCKRVVNLERRTVVPGLVDNHNHILLLGIRPGWHTPIESAADFGDIAAIWRARARNAPPGAFITSIGGFNRAQLTEKRLPTLAELDAMLPNNPVYIQESFTGPSATNSAGRAFFQSKGVAVDANGGLPAVPALTALRSVQTFADKKRGTVDALAYAAALGVTANFDMGGFLIPGSPDHEDEFTFDGAASWDPYTAYEPILAIHREGRMQSRVRIFFLSMDNAAATPILSRRLQNAFREFGDDWLRTGGLGEFITNWPLFGNPTLPSNYPAALKKAAERGWIYQQHTLSSGEDGAAISAWEQLNQTIPIAGLNWSLAHVPFITQQNIDRLKALGAGVALHGWRYLAGTPAQNGPPYRTILESGIKAGAGSDSAQISTLNPWLMLYYMTTGRNSSGVLINAGQQISRHDALRLYTRENGWFSKEEDKLGSIEPGKLGDLVVLNGDYFSVPDETLRQLGSVLTVVGGRITHDAGVLRGTGR